MPMFRFSIRDLLWLTVVLGISLAWFLDHRRMASVLEKNHHSYEELLYRYNKLTTAMFS
jgi:hypothetical protein